MKSISFIQKAAVAAVTAAVFAVFMSGTAQAAPNPGLFRAQLSSISKATISSGISAKIARMPFREGQRFRRGQTLVSYDCSVIRARLARTRAAQAAAASRLKSAEELNKLNSISLNDYDAARSAVKVAAAETAEQRSELARCSVSAPFSGIVGETFVRSNEYVAEGTRLLTIYDDSAFEVETLLPSSSLRTLRVGTKLQLKVDETGGVYPVQVTRIAGSVDPVSQSVKVTGRLLSAKSGSVRLLPGMSGTVSFVQ